MPRLVFIIESTTILNLGKLNIGGISKIGHTNCWVAVYYMLDNNLLMGLIWIYRPRYFQEVLK